MYLLHDHYLINRIEIFWYKLVVWFYFYLKYKIRYSYPEATYGYLYKVSSLLVTADSCKYLLEYKIFIIIGACSSTVIK